MAWIYLADMAEHLNHSPDMCDQSLIVKSAKELSAFYCEGCKKAKLRKRRFGMMRKHCEESTSNQSSTSLQADGHARTSALLAVGQAWTAQRVNCFGKSQGLHASFSRNSSSWKTAQTSWLTDMGLTESLGSWPRRGLMLAGECYRLSMWERRTY